MNEMKQTIPKTRKTVKIILVEHELAQNKTKTKGA